LILRIDVKKSYKGIMCVEDVGLYTTGSKLFHRVFVYYASQRFPDAACNIDAANSCTGHLSDADILPCITHSITSC
jgi:hypothetical protein